MNCDDTFNHSEEPVALHGSSDIVAAGWQFAARAMGRRLTDWSPSTQRRGERMGFVPRQIAGGEPAAGTIGSGWRSAGRWGRVSGGQVSW